MPKEGYVVRTAHPAPGPMRVRAELLMQGMTMADLARKLGVSRQAVHQTIVGKYPYKGYKLRPLIASAIGRRVDDIWPD